MMATPIPVLARPKQSGFWQSFWAKEISEKEFPGYAQSTELKRWLARHIVDLSPGSVVEFGCNVGANLREIHAIERSIRLYGIELNEKAVEWGRRNVVSPDAACLLCGSMADAKAILEREGIRTVDVVFTSAAAMHCDDAIFASAKEAALELAQKAIVHLEMNAWTPADLQNGRAWRRSFLSDRWIRDYVGEYSSAPPVDRIEVKPVPLAINYVDNIGRIMVSDVSGLIIVHLKSRPGA
jgi:Methyltransferase domain